MAVIGSVRALEQMDESDTQAHGPGRQAVPGIVVVLNAASPQAPAVVDVTPDASVPPPAQRLVGHSADLTRRKGFRARPVSKIQLC